MQVQIAQSGRALQSGVAEGYVFQLQFPFELLANSAVRVAAIFQLFRVEDGQHGHQSGLGLHPSVIRTHEGLKTTPHKPEDPREDHHRTDGHFSAQI